MNNQKIDHIGLVGVGLMGACWAAVFSSNGRQVKLYDHDPAACRAGREKAVEHLGFLKDHQMISGEQYEEALANLSVVDSLEEVVRGVEFVQESASDRYEVKKELFREIDRHAAADVIVASSSSGLLMTEIQQVMEHPERALIAHPFNPPHLIPLVELVPGEQTDPRVVERMKDFYEQVGKIPVVAKKEVPGYIANRLQAALWREAIDLVLRGVVSVEDVDKALYAGPGIRWALMGHHLTYHLAGGPGGMDDFIDHMGENIKYMWNDMGAWTDLPPQTKAVLREGLEEEIGTRTFEELVQWRNEKLVALLKEIY